MHNTNKKTNNSIYIVFDGKCLRTTRKIWPFIAKWMSKFLLDFVWLRESSPQPLVAGVLVTMGQFPPNSKTHKWVQVTNVRTLRTWEAVVDVGILSIIGACTGVGIIKSEQIHVVQHRTGCRIPTASECCRKRPCSCCIVLVPTWACLFVWEMKRK